MNRWYFRYFGYFVVMKAVRNGLRSTSTPPVIRNFNFSIWPSDNYNTKILCKLSNDIRRNRPLLSTQLLHMIKFDALV